MCGRFTNRYSWSELSRLYSLAGSAPPPSNFRPRYNIAPTDTVPVIRRRAGGRAADFLKWGLVPLSAKNTADAAKLINARAETVADKPLFRSAFLHRRCLVAADGFYEWKKVSAKQKAPYFITLRDNAPFAFAGIYEYWIPREGPRLETFAILTCAPNSLIAPLHDRMPVILPPETWPAWLGEQLVSPDRLKMLLKPFPPEHMDAWPVGPRVGNVANDDEGLIARESGIA